MKLELEKNKLFKKWKRRRVLMLTAAERCPERAAATFLPRWRKMPPPMVHDCSNRGTPGAE